MNLKSPVGIALVLALTLALVAGAVLGYLYLTTRATHIKDKAEAAEALATLSDTNATLSGALESKRLESDRLAEELMAEQKRNGTFAKTIEGIQSTVATLEKLQATDEELLAKYSKVYFLSDTYVPATLSEISSKYVVQPERQLEFHTKAIGYLEDMIEDAARDGIELRVASAYRSFATQAALKSSYTVSYGSGANRFSADQGYSEHQLGTTVDLSTKALGTNFTQIESTTAYEWLTKNAYRYGFILSYPKGNTHYQYEPWHWRFVGVALATDLHKKGQYMYQLEQRDIDTYLVNLFD